MSWTTLADLKAQLQRLWDRGELLADMARGDTRFPLRLQLKTPGSADLRDRFEAVRAWATALGAASPLRLEYQQVRHRVQGNQSLPAQAWLDSAEAALSWIKRNSDAHSFAQVLEQTRQRQPLLLPWLAKHPLQALSLAQEWPRLLDVVAWVAAHPRPGIYLRQVDLPGVHSKFIESHAGLLSELFDACLPPHGIDMSRTGRAQFAARYGFLDKTPKVRFRVLDPAIASLAGVHQPDISIDAPSFQQLQLGVRRVFITENETNFLAFPNQSASIVIFGAGYGWGHLAQCAWLGDCSLHYWGDIDTHGFAILDQLRSHFPTVQSMLMDRASLDAHVAYWGVENLPTTAELTRLQGDEQALYDALRFNTIRSGLRLEQEHIRYGWLCDHLQTLAAKAPTGPHPQETLG